MASDKPAGKGRSPGKPGDKNLRKALGFKSSGQKRITPKRTPEGQADARSFNGIKGYQKEGAGTSNKKGEDTQ